MRKMCRYWFGDVAAILGEGGVVAGEDLGGVAEAVRDDVDEVLDGVGAAGGV